MRSKSFVLLKALLQSTSSINALKNCNDSKKKSKLIGSAIGMSVLYLMLMAYCILMCYGYGQLGLIDAVPAFTAIIVSVLAFMFTLFKTNGYLFGFKEYDMLMALPFEVKTVAGCKFLYMYMKSLTWYVSVSFAMLIGYCIFADFSPVAIPVWIVLTFFVPVIPMLVASFFGYLFAVIGSHFSRGGKIVQTVLIFALVIFSFFLRFIIEAVVKDSGKTDELITSASEMVDNTGKVLLPVKWFSDAILRMDVVAILLLIVTSVVLFEIVFAIVGKNYRKINSALKSSSSARAFTFTEQKKSNILNSIAYKELKRMLGSTTYLTNAAMGEVFCLVFGIAALFVGMDRIIAITTKGAPVSADIIVPAIPFAIYFFIGMVATTAITPSLEGKNYWILQSLPIEKTTIYKGKMLFNIYLTVPFALFGTICLCISAKVTVPDTILAVLCIVSLCMLSTTWGCVCGIRHMKLEWENEIEVVKQGAALSIYLLPNMFGTMIITVGVVFLGIGVGAEIAMIIPTILALLLSAAFYKRSMVLAKRQK